MWNGSSWQDLYLTSQITSSTSFLDLAIIENSDGSGILVAASYDEAGGSIKVDLWDYSGTEWTKIGPTVDPPEGALSVNVSLDSSSRPVLILAKGADRSLHSLVYRE